MLRNFLICDKSALVKTEIRWAVRGRPLYHTRKCTMTIISERLQHLRLTHGYTQTDLARTMGVSRRAVYAWEHDKCPEIPHLIQLAQFYQVSTDYLLGLTE